MKIKHITTDTEKEYYDISGQEMKLCQIYIPAKLARKLQIVAIYNKTNWLNRELNELVEAKFLPMIEKYIKSQFIKHNIQFKKIKTDLQKNKAVLTDKLFL